MLKYLVQTEEDKLRFRICCLKKVVIFLQDNEELFSYPLLKYPITVLDARKVLEG